jgi:hypothetical protein
MKVKTEDPESRRMMKSIEESLEAIKVNLAKNQKPRRTIPTSRMMFGTLGVEIRVIMQANARDLRQNGSITLIRKMRYFMLNQRGSGGDIRNLPSTTYIRTRKGTPAFDLTERLGKPELSSRNKSGSEFQQSGKIFQLR